MHETQDGECFKEGVKRRQGFSERLSEYDKRGKDDIDRYKGIKTSEGSIIRSIKTIEDKVLIRIYIKELTESFESVICLTEFLFFDKLKSLVYKC